MLKPEYKKQFKKDIELAKKRGKDTQKLKDIIDLIIEEKPLLVKHRNHKLKGQYNGAWECHIEPDWLLIYELTSIKAIFVRTGSHSDLF
jgi:mRNA interferase YafQ